SIPGVFSGRTGSLLEDKAVTATLVLRETGDGALPRPQRIPILLPPRDQSAGTATRESFTYGLNDQLLQSIAVSAGTKYDSIDGIGRPGELIDPQQSRALWPLAAGLGIVCYLAAIFLRRLDP